MDRRVEEGQRRRQHGTGERGPDRAEVEHPDEVEPAAAEHQQRAYQRARPRDSRRTEGAGGEPRHKDHEGEEQHVGRGEVRLRQQPQRCPQQRIPGHPRRGDHAVDDPRIPVRHVVLAPREGTEELRDAEKERGMIVRIWRGESGMPQQQDDAHNLAACQQRGQQLTHAAHRRLQEAQQHKAPGEQEKMPGHLPRPMPERAEPDRPRVEVEAPAMPQKVTKGCEAISAKMETEA